jgi:hypothetical protein
MGSTACPYDERPAPGGPAVPATGVPATGVPVTGDRRTGVRAALLRLCGLLCPYVGGRVARWRGVPNDRQ